MPPGVAVQLPSTEPDDEAHDRIVLRDSRSPLRIPWWLPALAYFAIVALVPVVTRSTPASGTGWLLASLAHLVATFVVLRGQPRPSGELRSARMAFVGAVAWSVLVAPLGFTLMVNVLQALGIPW